jgi:hypothetical protein
MRQCRDQQAPKIRFVRDGGGVGCIGVELRLHRRNPPSFCFHCRSFLAGVPVEPGAFRMVELAFLFAEKPAAGIDSPQHLAGLGNADIAFEFPLPILEEAHAFAAAEVAIDQHVFGHGEALAGFRGEHRRGSLRSRF